MLADKAVELGFADEVWFSEKQKQDECTECDRYELCIQYVG